MKKLTVATLLLSTFLVLGCGSKYSPTTKTQEQISADYHKNLTTPDLSLFELVGNVKRVIYPKGFLSQYDGTATSSPDTIHFDANGMCAPLFVEQADTLYPVRTTDGVILQMSNRSGSRFVRFLFNERGKVVSWLTANNEVRLTYTDRHVCEMSVQGSNGQEQYKIANTSVDPLGNWTERTIAHGGKTIGRQARQISYY